eukprot:COSAG01_NODE_67_length_29188_cov_1135.609474_20_plen_71_part_00
MIFSDISGFTALGETLERQCQGSTGGADELGPRTVAAEQLAVSAPSPPFVRAASAEIRLCHAWSCQEIYY